MLFCTEVLLADVGIEKYQIWSNDRYFKGESSGVTYSKVNYRKITLLYLNQAYLTVKKGKA